MKLIIDGSIAKESVCFNEILDVFFQEFKKEIQKQDLSDKDAVIIELKLRKEENNDNACEC